MKERTWISSEESDQTPKLAQSSSSLEFNNPPDVQRHNHEAQTGYFKSDHDKHVSDGAYKHKYFDCNIITPQPLSTYLHIVKRCMVIVI